MLYLLAFLLPPMAVLMCGKPFQAILNVVLTLFFWVPGFIHACFVVNGHYHRQRLEELAVIAGATRNRR
jgi:uncharacterized membrane protein YqaE (UPF0057 family)